MTRIFDLLETRGVDAAGIWGAESGPTGRVVYHKSPIQSSEFIELDLWKRIKKVKFNLFLAHARATSKGGGDASDNNNNHPFVNVDKNIAMIHNGTLDESDYLSKKYQILSKTDSEYLLRMYEHGMDQLADLPNETEEIQRRISGVKEIWSHIDTGAMAVAIGERHSDGGRGLLLFRNEKRPLWIADLRDTMGQIFFVSSPEIWHKAICDDSNLTHVCQNAKLIELPPQQAWYFRIDNQVQFIKEENVTKFKITVKDSGEEFDPKEYCPVKEEKKQHIDIITDVERPRKTSKPIGCTFIKTHLTKHYPAVDPYDVDDDLIEIPQSMNDHLAHSDLCRDIISIINSLDTAVDNRSKEGSMTDNEYELIIESLLQFKSDAQGTLSLLG